uniref:G_PROTEIN_RECEP_F1_2 domain-containing protein n=1 Tax=Ascaris lumbricoides TaxID=6252 RepID=A0A0M3IGE2_ASCLU
MWKSIGVILRMSQIVGSWKRIARQFLERSRGFSIDEVVEEKRQILIAVMLLTFSALWHCFSVPNPLGILRWGVTMRPQVNVKPRMVCLLKSIAFLSVY